MNEYDPILKEIKDKQKNITEDVKLLKKKKKINRLTLVTSLVLAVGIIIGIIRTLIAVSQ